MRPEKIFVNNEVLAAVDQGLSRAPKSLPSWLFYNEKGSLLFQQIMKLPEYYLTKCEYEIMETHKHEMLAFFAYDMQPFHLIELGAGDAVKTEILLEYFVERSVELDYIPVDVSQEILIQLTQRLHLHLPSLSVNPIAAKYEDALSQMDISHRKVIVFLGANIGNYSLHDATTLVRYISRNMQAADLLMIGFDLKKDPRVIHRAYDDSMGVTSEFNLNLLERMNEELGAHFNLSNFAHFPFYDPQLGLMHSFLVSTVRQSVFVESLNKTFHFDEWESIHTEVSQKYDLQAIHKLARQGGLQVVEVFYDSKKYFCNVIFRKL